MRPRNRISLHIFIIYLFVAQNEAGFLFGEPCSERNTLEINETGTTLPTHHIACVDIRNSGSLNLEPYRCLMKNATTLYAQNKSFNRMPYNLTRTMRQLELIDLSNNNIRFFHPKIFQYQKQLKTLMLNANKVFMPKQRVLMEVESLQNLHLSDNGIKRLGERAFEGVPNLVVLFLDGNYLKVVNGGVFKSLKSLKLLDLGRNKIKLFEGRGLLPKGLDVFILRRNPVECDEEFGFFNTEYCK